MGSDVRKKLKAFVSDLNGPLGRVPFDRILRKHIDTFADLRENGCTWTQIGHELGALGARRSDGGIISPDHLRGAVARQLKTKPRSQTESEKPIPSKRYPESLDASQLGQPMSMNFVRQKSNLKPRNSASVDEQVATGRSSNGSAKSILEKLARTKALRES